MDRRSTGRRRTLVTTQGRTIKVAQYTHLVVRRVLRTAWSVTATDGSHSVDLVVLPTKAEAIDRAHALSATCGLDVSESMPAGADRSRPSHRAGDGLFTL